MKQKQMHIQDKAKVHQQIMTLSSGLPFMHCIILFHRSSDIAHFLLSMRNKGSIKDICEISKVSTLSLKFYSVWNYWASFISPCEFKRSIGK